MSLANLIKNGLTEDSQESLKIPYVYTLNVNSIGFIHNGIIKCVDEAHDYLIPMNPFMDDEVNYHPLSFLKMTEPGTYIQGVTNEQLLIVLIDRLDKLNKKFPCDENAIAIKALNDAYEALETRTKNRIRRNVEGQHKL